MRGVLYGYRRVVVAKKFARKLRGKLINHLGRKPTQEAHSFRLAAFSEYVAAATATQNEISDVRPAAAAIDAVSYLRDRDAV